MKPIAFASMLALSGLAFTNTVTADTNCDFGTQIIESDMSIHLNGVKLGEDLYWAKLDFAGENDNGDGTWTLAEHGLLDCVDDGSDAIVRMDSALDLNINIAQLISQSSRSDSGAQPLNLEAVLDYVGADSLGTLSWTLKEFNFIDAINSVIDNVVDKLPKEEDAPSSGFSITTTDDPNHAANGGFSLSIGPATGNGLTFGNPTTTNNSNSSDDGKTAGFSITLDTEPDPNKTTGFSISIDGSTQNTLNMLNQLAGFLF